MLSLRPRCARPHSIYRKSRLALQTDVLGVGGRLIALNLEGTKLRGSQGMGVVSNKWLDCVLLSFYVHVQTLMLTDAQTPFLGAPLVPLELEVNCVDAATMSRFTLCAAQTLTQAQGEPLV